MGESHVKKFLREAGQEELLEQQQPLLHRCTRPTPAPMVGIPQWQRDLFKVSNRQRKDMTIQKGDEKVAETLTVKQARVALRSQLKPCSSNRPLIQIRLDLAALLDAKPEGLSLDLHMSKLTIVMTVLSLVSSAACIPHSFLCPSL
jgi:hypothetical protein